MVSLWKCFKTNVFDDCRFAYSYAFCYLFNGDDYSGINVPLVTV